MQVLLKKDIPNLGQAGDIKNVKTGYARNYLMPKNLVLIADAKSRKEQFFLNQVQERKIVKRKREAEKSSSELRGMSVKLIAKLGSEGKFYGSITNIDIHKALLEKGVTIDRRTIVLNEPIKTLGIFKVSVKIYQGVAETIEVIVADEEGNTSIQEAKAVDDSENMVSEDEPKHTLPEETPNQSSEEGNVPVQKIEDNDKPEPEHIASEESKSDVEQP